MCIDWRWCSLLALLHCFHDMVSSSNRKFRKPSSRSSSAFLRDKYMPARLYVFFKEPTCYCTMLKEIVPLAGILVISAENMSQPLRIQLPTVDGQVSLHSQEKDTKARSKIQINLCAASVCSMRVSLSCFHKFLTRNESLLSDKLAFFNQFSEIVGFDGKISHRHCMR